MSISRSSWDADAPLRRSGARSRVYPTGERKRGTAQTTRKMAVHVAHLHSRMWEIPYIDPDEVITELPPEVLGTASGDCAVHRA